LASFIFIVLSAVFSVSGKVRSDGNWMLFNPLLRSEGWLATGLFLLWIGLGIFLGKKMRETLKEK